MAALSFSWAMQEVSYQLFRRRGSLRMASRAAGEVAAPKRALTSGRRFVSRVGIPSVETSRT